MTDNRATELLPCPFCGGQPDFQHFNITPNVQGRIVCSCGIELRQGKNDTEDDMRIIWNTRSDYAVQAENERKAEQAIAATLGSGTCRILASATDGLCSDSPRQWFVLSCGHSFTLDGLGAPVACPVCGKAVKR